MTGGGIGAAACEPNGTLWFEADLDREGDWIWLRIEEKAIRRMPDATPEGRGRRVLDALHVWRAAPRPLRWGTNRFKVRVATRPEREHSLTNVETTRSARLRATDRGTRGRAAVEEDTTTWYRDT